jgi:hypothetical protein
VIYKLFDWVATALGRKYAFVDFFGDVGFYRYYFFYVERHDANNWVSRYLPNLYVHHFPGGPSNQEPDGARPHCHPWNTLSVMIKGGYTEMIDHSEKRVSIAPALVYLNHKRCHRLIQAKPDTWTLFFHGSKRQEWSVQEQVSSENGETLIRLKEDASEKIIRVRPLDPDIEITKSSEEARGWRKAKWIKVDDGFERLVSERKKMLKRLNIQKPNSAAEKVEVLNNFMLKVRYGNVQE